MAFPRRRHTNMQLPPVKWAVRPPLVLWLCQVVTFFALVNVYASCRDLASSMQFQTPKCANPEFSPHFNKDWLTATVAMTTKWRQGLFFLVSDIFNSRNYHFVNQCSAYHRFELLFFCMLFVSVSCCCWSSCFALTTGSRVSEVAENARGLLSQATIKKERLFYSPQFFMFWKEHIE